MKISGFTIARQAVTLGYPLVESLQSLLPLVDELVVNVGDGDDGTWETVIGLGDPKITAFRSTWDTTTRDGLVLSQETNKALVRCQGDWAVYLQADEVLHEHELPALRAALERYRDSRIETMSLLYHHFYGSYHIVMDDPRYWYHRASRVVRTGIGVESAGDGNAFVVREGGGTRRPRRKDLSLHVYHYGWTRPPEVMLRKQRNAERLHGDDTWLAQYGLKEDMDPQRIYARSRHLRAFPGTHPAVMRARVAAQNWSFDPPLPHRGTDWLRRGYVYGSWFVQKAWSRVTARR